MGSKNIFVGSKNIFVGKNFIFFVSIFPFFCGLEFEFFVENFWAYQIWDLAVSVYIVVVAVVVVVDIFPCVSKMCFSFHFEWKLMSTARHKTLLSLDWNLLTIAKRWNKIFSHYVFATILLIKASKSASLGNFLVPYLEWINSPFTLFFISSTDLYNVTSKLPVVPASF